MILSKDFSRLTAVAVSSGDVQDICWNNVIIQCCCSIQANHAVAGFILAGGYWQRRRRAAGDIRDDVGSVMCRPTVLRGACISAITRETRSDGRGGIEHLYKERPLPGLDHSSSAFTLQSFKQHLPPSSLSISDIFNYSNSVSSRSASLKSDISSFDQFITMKLAIFVAGLLAGTAYAGCYSGGVSWDNEAELAIAAAADRFSEGVLPAGTPGPEQVFEVPLANYYVKFIVQNLSGYTWQLPRNYVYDMLMREVDGCEHGGDRSYEHWRFV